MSSRGRKKLVLNSHRFFRDISPEVLKELSQGENEDDAERPTGRGDAELYHAIREGNHRIILTDGLRKEYISEALNEGFSALLVGHVIEQLRENGLITEPRLPGGNPDFPGIPSYPRVSPNTAIIADADYLITDRRLWLSRSDDITNDYGVMVVTPGRFIQREGR